MQLFYFSVYLRLPFFKLVLKDNWRYGLSY